MEQKQQLGASCRDRLSVKYPWLQVAQNLEAEVDDAKYQISYTMHDPLSLYRYQIPELLGRHIRGCFHGWVILSNNHPHNVRWSLWNPYTCKLIRLPPLILKDGDFESIGQSFLSSPPYNDPTSVLMLTRTKKPTIVFCHLDRKRKRLRWKEITYTKQLRSIISGGGTGFLHCLTCCNGKTYALISGSRIVIQVGIAVKDKELVISLLPFGKLPYTFYNHCNFFKPYLKGYCTKLFYIMLGFEEVANKRLGVVSLFKLDWTSMIWEEMEDLKDVLIFVDLALDCSISYRHAIASELGGYIHILGDMGKIIYSYHVKDRTISISSFCCLMQTTHGSLQECRYVLVYLS